MDQPWQVAAKKDVAINSVAYLAEGVCSAPILIVSFLTIQRRGDLNMTLWFLPALMGLYIRFFLVCFIRFDSNVDDGTVRFLGLACPISAATYVVWYLLGSWLVLGRSHMSGAPLCCAFAWLVLSNVALCSLSLVPSAWFERFTRRAVPDPCLRNSSLPMLLGHKGRFASEGEDKHVAHFAVKGPRTPPPRRTRTTDPLPHSGESSAALPEGIADRWGCRRRRPMQGSV